MRSNQLDFDEEVMFKSTRYLYAAARRPASSRPFCLTVSMTHPHDPYTIQKQYWDRYEDVDIPQPEVKIPKGEQDAHSKRLLKVCDLWDKDMPEEAIERARRAYFGAMSYVDDNVGKLLEVLKECGMEDDTIVIFSSDHGDMLGERGLWYAIKLSGNMTLAFPLIVTSIVIEDLLNWADMMRFTGTRCLGLKRHLVCHFSSPIQNASSQSVYHIMSRPWTSSPHLWTLWVNPWIRDYL